MFKLHRLEITGFKSFADHTEIVFTGNGITAVVGPNGCGKSNVADAISWVLGEQRARSLRGTEMKDVVFQGTKNRKPSGMAEVVLHLVRDESALDIDDRELEDIDETLSEIDDKAVDLDSIEADQAEADSIAVLETAVEHEAPIETNGFHREEIFEERVQAAQVGSAQVVERTIRTKRHWRPRSFALDFAPGEAVSVTRRLYLSGESEYQLNGRTCRLRDIQDLFAGTGLSGAHYAIIEQGRIGQILSAKPSDRRNLIEEAAGISKFRTRQRAAETRLENAKTNLGRISDIVSEIEKQANSLRRQAAKTRRYIALQGEFRALLRHLFAAEGSHLGSLIEELNTDLGAAKEREQSLAAEVRRTEELFRDATQAARAAEESLSGIRGKHAENALERDRNEREHRYQSEQITNLKGRIGSLLSDIEAASERARLAASEHERLIEEERAESAEADACRLILVEAEKLYTAKVEDVKQIEAEMDARRHDLMQHAAALERFDEVARQLELNLERANERSTGLHHEAARAAETRAEHLAEAERIAEETAAERAKLESFIAERQELFESAASARETLRLAEGSLRAAQNEHSRTRNRLETLRELEEKRAVYAPQIQKLFAAQNAIGIRPLGVMADFLDVGELAEKAVESLFGQYLQTVLVNDIAEARKIAEWLRENQIGRVPILIAPGIRPGHNGHKSAGAPETIEAALGASSELIAVLRRAFPRELAAILVADLENAAVSEGSIVVNTEGEILAGGGLYVSGPQAQDGKNESLLAFKRELSSLSRSEEILGRDVAAAESKVVEARAALSEIEERTVDLQSVIIKVERHLLSLELTEKNVRQEVDRAERHEKVIAAELAQVSEEAEDIRRKLEDARSSRRNADNLRETAVSDIEAISLRLADAREHAESENNVLNEKRTLAATTGERRRAVRNAIDRIESERKELEIRISTLRFERETTEQRIEELTSSVEAIAARIGGASAEIEAENEELIAAVSAVAASRQNADQVSHGLAELNHRAADAMNDRAAIEVRQAESVTELRNIHENCLNELGIALETLVETESLPEEFDLGAERKRAAEMRERLEGFGAINMLAVEELAETEERLLFLTSQRQDIIESIASAEEALREIKERSRERFRAAFEAINENFGEFFRELFGGGRGEMSLLESEDILEAGIEVVAQPPGKRLQNILLLSGGEKAMTAIALVLAIFRYRPSPFCLLDEVDAPLDEANVGRFVGKIAEMSENTQFIVITHNKRTMEAARALYGVTMQEAGVSQVVSVRFE